MTNEEKHKIEHKTCHGQLDLDVLLVARFRFHYLR